MTRLRNIIRRFTTRRPFRHRFLRQLPAPWHEVAEFAFLPQMTAEESLIADRIEEFRETIPALTGTAEIQSYSTPHSKTFRRDVHGHSVVDTLGVRRVDQLIKTGANAATGILLRRITQAVGAQRVLELGTNTGFSGAYFLSVPGVQLVTVEGSASLCPIAIRNMSRISDRFEVHNALFDAAIDELADRGETFDMVFIDGQHEEDATLHYAERVRPLMSDRAAFVFDDIYWSEGMQQAWQSLSTQAQFSITIDLLSKGIAVLGGDDEQPIRHDLGNVLPRPEIFRKNW